MPSPTDRTCPTSATSASLPKPAICCLRIAEISAARISISTLPISSSPPRKRGSRATDSTWALDSRFRGNDGVTPSTGSFHSQPQALQPAIQRGVDHPRADLDDHATEEARVDPDVDNHPRPDRAAQLLEERSLARLVQRLGNGDLGGDLAAPLGEFSQIRFDHRRHRKEAPVLRDQPEKIADQIR